MRLTASMLDASERTYLDRTTRPGTHYEYVLVAVDTEAGTFRSAPIGIDLPARVSGLVIHPNRPNPFNPATHIRYTVPEAGAVHLSVYDARGQLVRVLVDRTQSSGEHAADWDGTNARGLGVASGVYFLRLGAAGTHETRKITLAK